METNDPVIQVLGEKESGEKKVHKLDPNKTIFKMMRTKIDKLLDDFIEYYYPKGPVGTRGIKVTIQIEKESGTEWHEDVFEYSDFMRLVHRVRIK